MNLLKAEIEKTLEEVNRQMSNYLPESELSRFNQAPANAPFRISPDFAGVVKFGLSLSQVSDGAFDPTLGPLINLWGFGEKTKEHTVPADEVFARNQGEDRLAPPHADRHRGTDQGFARYRSGSGRGSPKVTEWTR